MIRNLVVEVGKSIGRYWRTAEPSLFSPSSQLVPWFPLGRPKGSLAGFPGSCPPRESHPSLLVTSEVELAIEKNAPLHYSPRKTRWDCTEGLEKG